jgi:NAD(P)-dependent dehydrogenase (short-subunit alcohol dehydrogenase family)
MSKKVVLITGANRGIGLSFVKAYLQKGWEVHATARKPEDAIEVFINLGQRPLFKADIV